MRTATTKFQTLHTKKVGINGPCPSSLTINKDSHFIRKPSSSSFTSHVALAKPQSNPTIIYTQSPKIIHTKPRDFMALVQRLTGMSHSNEHVFDDTSYENSGSLLCGGSHSNLKREEKEHQEEEFWDGGRIISPDVRGGETCVEEEPFVLSNLGFADLPIFTPNSVCKYADSPFGFFSTLLSPSGLEFMKELPEY